MVKNKELIILVGISGSGKSTWTENYIKNTNNTLRINRDDLGKSLVKDLKSYYQRADLNQLEIIISTTSYSLFNILMDLDKDIILDNTNLKKDYFSNFIILASANNYNIKFKLFDCNIITAKKRILDRDYNTWCDDEDLFLDQDILSKTSYIDTQLEQYENIKRYILKEYAHLIMH